MSHRKSVKEARRQWEQTKALLAKGSDRKEGRSNAPRPLLGKVRPEKKGVTAAGSGLGLPEKSTPEPVTPEPKAGDTGQGIQTDSGQLTSPPEPPPPDDAEPPPPDPTTRPDLESDWELLVLGDDIDKLAAEVKSIDPSEIAAVEQERAPDETLKEAEELQTTAPQGEGESSTVRGSAAVPEGLVSAVRPELKGTDRGLVNGCGATNGTRIFDQGAVNGKGLVNGRGLVNGKGLVNGRGLVNGTGMTNGARVGGKPFGTPRGRVTLRKWQLVAALVTLSLLASGFMLLIPAGEPGPSIDGEFEEWAGVMKFDMEELSGAPELSVDEWAIQSNGRAFYLYVRTLGMIMSPSEVSSFYLFIDSDNNPITGYSVSSIGAELMLELHGWDGEVRSTTLSRYGPSADHYNWSEWSGLGHLVCAVDSDRFEAKAELPDAFDSGARLLLLSQNNLVDRLSAVSHPVSAGGGTLIVRQEPGVDVSADQGTLPPGPAVSALRLVLSCEGAPGTVNSITATVSGAALVSIPSSISLLPGEEETRDVVVDSSSCQSFDLVSALVAQDGVNSTFSEVVIVGAPVRAYVAAPPASIEIDGAFGDWDGRVSVDEDAFAVGNPDINITAVGAANASYGAAFYVDVKGLMCHGSYAPMTMGKPSGDGGGGGAIIQPRKAGEDLLRIFIDSDLSNSSGQPVVRGDKFIGADYLIEIVGMNGKIVSKSIHEYAGPGWTSVQAEVSAEKDTHQIELSIPSEALWGNSSFRTVFETTDWRDTTDFALVGGQIDPWAITSSGNTYTSLTGAVWSSIGAPSLVVGDTVVDMTTNPTRNIVYAVTNSGRTYRWVIGPSVAWSGALTNPIGGAANVIAITAYADAGAFILTSDGRPFYDADLTTTSDWAARQVIPGGKTDFIDLVWRSGSTDSTANLYAIRAAQNTRLYYTLDGGTTSFTQTGSVIGKDGPHTQMAVVPGASLAQDQLFMLRESGALDYSNNGGSSWSMRGNLPVPLGTNSTRYTGISIDLASNIWVVTNTGYCFESTDGATTFTYKGRVPSTPVAGIVTPIPEFGLVPAIIVATLTLAELGRRRRRRT